MNKVSALVLGCLIFVGTSAFAAPLPHTACAEKMRDAILKDLKFSGSPAPAMQIFTDITKDGIQVIHVDDTAASGGEDLYVEYLVPISNSANDDCIVGPVKNHGGYR